MISDMYTFHNNKRFQLGIYWSYTRYYSALLQVQRLFWNIRTGGNSNTIRILIL
jgi:hypothetical protein